MKTIKPPLNKFDLKIDKKHGITNNRKYIFEIIIYNIILIF